LPWYTQPPLSRFHFALLIVARHFDRSITPAGSTDCDGGHFSEDNRAKVVPCKVPESKEF